MATSFFNRLRRDVRGQSLAEFALAVPILLLLVFGIIEFSRHYYARLSIRHAVAEAARFHATGQTQEGAENRAASISQAIETRAAALGLTVGGIEIDGEVDRPGATVTIRATLTFNFLIMPLIQSFAPEFLDFTVATTYKNEPAFHEPRDDLDA